MAVYPGGFNDLQTARRRTIFYIAGVGVIAGILVIGGYMLLKGRAEPAQEPPPAAPTETVVAETGAPVQPPPAPQTATNEASPERNAAPAAVATVIVAPATAEPNQDVSGLIAQAMELLNTGAIGAGGPKIIEARDRLNEILPMANGRERAFIKEQMAQLSEKWLFSRLVYPQDALCAGYKVNSGDMLSTISKQHNVPYEILMQINGIARPEQLQAGITIKVVNGPFNARIYRSTFTMHLYLQNTYVRSFQVGLGKPGMETPTGRWRVKSDGKLIQPIWTDPQTNRTYHPEDPDYPLGSRWIALEGIEGAAVGRTGFAIHGTKDPQQIGGPGSQGCIRLHNGDAILVYNLLMPGVSLVDVVD
ncbi:MAG: L,D-transpeptidase family protein [Sedimentisphaerales bacterium]|nr:L,D-transpeptidase family protein [Sedimentisphaerales bacterium]